MYISWRSGLFCLVLLQANTLFISILMQNTLLKPSFWHKWAAWVREKADKVPNSRQQDPQLMSKKIWIMVPLSWWRIFRRRSQERRSRRGAGLGGRCYSAGRSYRPSPSPNVHTKRPKHFLSKLWPGLMGAAQLHQFDMVLFIAV